MSYEEKNYTVAKDLYGAIYQAYTNVKDEMYSHHGWNRVSATQDGFSLRVVANFLEICHQHCEAGNQYDMKGKLVGFKKLNEFEKKLKKEFKKLTGKNLTLKVVKEKENDVERVTRTSPDTGFLSSTYGANTGTFYIKNAKVYDITTKL